MGGKDFLEGAGEFVVSAIAHGCGDGHAGIVFSIGGERAKNVLQIWIEVGETANEAQTKI